MRTALITAVLFVLAVPALAPSATQKATLRVVDTHPLTVRGASFGPRKAVIVTVRQEDSVRARRSVRTSAVGRFAVAFTGPVVHRCSGDATITAVGASGAVATVKLPQPLCPPPP